MATLAFNGTSDKVTIPVTTQLNNIPNGACTIAWLLARTNTTTDDDVGGLRGGSAPSGGYYHGVRLDNSAAFDVYDDNTFTLSHFNTNISQTGTNGDDFFMVVTDWPASNATSRAHVSTKISTAESWTHVDSDAANGGLQSGPGVGTGYFIVGDYDGALFLGSIALLGIWTGVRFTDTDVTNLWVNLKTSDWYLHSAGHPDTLIEFTSTSPTDIGDNPASGISVSGAAATGNNPTGWTFDGRGTLPGLPVAAWKPNFVYLRKNR